MGKSKFPGKPSKLVNKKRVSVLNSVVNNQFCENFNEDDGDQVSSCESETTKTFDGTQVIITCRREHFFWSKLYNTNVVEYFNDDPM